MAMHSFRFMTSAPVTVELDDSLLPDDEWRRQFYNLVTLQDVAEHIAFNAAANGVTQLNRLDGFADRDNALAKVSVGAFTTEPE